MDRESPFGHPSPGSGVCALAPTRIQRPWFRRLSWGLAGWLGLLALCGVADAQEVRTIDIGRRNVTRMLTDHQRPFVYAVQPGTNAVRGNLLFINTATEALARVIPLATNPTDMTINYAEGRLYVTDWLSGWLRVVDLETQTELAPMPVPIGLDRVNAGRAGRVVMEDWNQWVGVFIYNTTNAAVLASGTLREGDAEMDASGRYYYHCDNNISSAAVSKWDLSADTWAILRSSDTRHPPGSRNLLLSPDGSRVFWRGYVYNPDLVEQRGLGTEIHATTLHGELAFGSNQVFNADNGQSVYTFASNSTVMAMANGQDKLLRFDRGTSNILVFPVSLFPVAVDAAMRPGPTNGQVVALPLERLSWSLTPWASRYHVYLGTNESDVAQAGTNSPLRLATTTEGFVAAPPGLALDQDYYWRVDSVGRQQATTGAVWRFRTGPVSVFPAVAAGKAVVGVPGSGVVVTLNAARPDVAWSSAESIPWLTVVPASGTGSAVVSLVFDITGLGPGTYTNGVTFTSGGATLNLPVRLEVAPLSLVRLLPDPARPTRLYAIHSDLTYTNNGVLLQYNTVTEQIERAMPLDREPTDMDLDAAEDALYVIHFTGHSIFKVNLATFQPTVVRSFPQPANNGGNQYDIKAGRGNLVYWVDGLWAPTIHVMDISTGAEVGLFDDGEGVGDIALSPDGGTLFAWRQFGWGAGSAVSWVRKLNSSGTTPVWVQNSTVGFGRDPLNSPVLVSAAGDRVIRNQYCLSATNLEVVLAMYSNEVAYAISPGADHVFTPNYAFDGNSGVAFYRFPFESSVVALAGQPEKVFRFNPTTRALVATPFNALTNLPPSGSNLNLTTPEDTSMPVLLAGWDPEGDAIRFVIDTPPARGTLTGTPPNLVYQPSLNVFGADAFTFFAVDAYRTSAVATVAINVTPVNDAPTANAQSVVVIRGAAKSITLTGSDPENNPLTYQIVNPPLHGGLTGTAPNLVFTNVPGYVGSDSFTFKVSDGQTDSAPATVSMTISPPPCLVPPAAIVGWWRGENGPHDWVGGNPLGVAGAVSYATGKVGQSFSLDGPGAGLTVPPSIGLNVNAVGAFTIEMWIAPAGFTTNQPLADWSASAYLRGPTLGLSASSNGASTASLFANIIDTNNGAHLLATTPIVTTGAWQHVALTYNRASGVAMLLLNGQVRTQASVGAIQFRSDAAFHLGHQPWPGGGRFNGRLDEPTVYNRALGTNELQALFLADDSGKCAAPRLPTLILQPSSQSVAEGASVTLAAAAAGTGPLVFQWLFNSMPLPAAQGPSYSIASATPAQAGLYRVVVTNAYGAATSVVAQLTVVRASAVSNGSFETGDFTGWMVQDVPFPFVPLSVRRAGYSPGYGFFTNSPTAGVFSAVHGLDGAGPGTIRVAQDVRVPTGHPVLTFDWRAGWDLLSFPGATQARVFAVTLGPAGGGASWQTNLLLWAPPLTRTLDTGPRQGAIALSAYAGAPLRISFDAQVPESFSGPGFFQLDNVDIVNAPPVMLVAAGIMPGPGGSIRIQFTADPARAYRVEATTNWTGWLPAGSATHQGNGLHQFIDMDAALHSQRFYRIVWP